MTPIDLIVVNARIYTGESTDPWVEALASEAGRICKLGSRADIESLASAETRRLDAGGRTVLPGFIDAHVHPIFAFQLGSWIDLSDHPSLAEVQRRVRSFATDHPQETVLRGFGFDYQALTDTGLPTSRDLDDAERDRPVILDSWDGHTAWTNGRFVDLAKSHFQSLGHEVGDPERDPQTGELTGIFRVSFDLDLPELKSRRSLDGLRQFLATAARYGITTVFDVQVPLEDLESYELLQSQGELPIHVEVAIYHPPSTTPGQYAAFHLASERCVGNRLRAGAVKLYIDGVQETHSAYLLRPYTDQPSSQGETVYKTSDFRTIVAELDRRGFQILTHACGDGGVRIVLDAYESLKLDAGRPPSRHRIEHCENVAPEDLGRFARLGVVPCMMPHHSSPELTRRWRQTMGEDRWRSGFPWKELLQAGAPLAFSSDWPVADLNPFVHLQSAVARQDPDGEPSPHRLSLTEAIDAYTRGAAYASNCASDRGTLAPGKCCDLVVLSENPFETPADQLRRVRVVTTLVEGRVVYQDLPAVAVTELVEPRVSGD